MFSIVWGFLVHTQSVEKYISLGFPQLRRDTQQFQYELRLLFLIDSHSALQRPRQKLAIDGDRYRRGLGLVQRQQ